MKKIVVFVLCVLLLISTTVPALGAEERSYESEEQLASSLKALGLFAGVSDTDFALQRAPTRTEAIVMLIRVLGKASEARSKEWHHPFTDVEFWANGYIGYAYENGLTAGVAADKFGNEDATAAMYITFVLRSLGYKSGANGDFLWNDPFSLAQMVGILPVGLDVSAFMRGDVVNISYAALNAKLKDSEQTLAEKLISMGVFTQEQFNENYSVEKANELTGKIVLGPETDDSGYPVITKGLPSNESIAIISLNSPAMRNQIVTLRAKGKPNTKYKLSVQYSTTWSSATGLGIETSDSEGYVEWTWKIGGKTNPRTNNIIKIEEYTDDNKPTGNKLEYNNFITLAESAE